MKKKQQIRVGTGMMILKRKQVLLGLRRDCGKWSMPGGKLDFGEDPISCSIRETREEVGILVGKRDTTLISVSTEQEKSKDEHWVTIGYLTRKFSGRARLKEPLKFVEWCWFPITDLPSPLYASSAAIIRAYHIALIRANSGI